MLGRVRTDFMLALTAYLDVCRRVEAQGVDVVAQYLDHQVLQGLAVRGPFGLHPEGIAQRLTTELFLQEISSHHPRRIPLSFILYLGVLYIKIHDKQPGLEETSQCSVC